MEPHIQYARTADGVSIAFWTLGEGPPLLITPPLSISHTELEWRSPELTRWYLKMAERRRIVRFDPRGYGLSQREVADLSLDAYVADMQAVADHLQLEHFALMAIRGGGPSAISYAARHPERVTHLVLWSCVARFADAFAFQQREMLEPMTLKDWEAYTETHAHIQHGWDNPLAHVFAQFIRASIEPEVWQAMLDALKDVDVSPLLAKVACPTLVLAGPDYPVPRATREIAAAIPSATFVPLKEGTHPVAGNTDTIDAAIDEFLGGSESTSVAARDGASAVHTILFTDIEGSTTLTQRLGDAKAQELLRAHNAIVRDALKTCGGSEIKHTGDGIMASFPSASRALECAVAIQREIGNRQSEIGEAVRVRIGLNAGEPVAEDQDLFGTAVQLARRICDHADAGEILVSNVVRELAAGKGFLFADTGEVVLKGFEDPVRLHAVRWREDA